MHPTPPPLLQERTNKNPEYVVEAILEYQATVSNTPQYMLKWLGYSKQGWQWLANSQAALRDSLRHYNQTMGIMVY